jgi:uncharacterized membrane protein
MNKSRLERLAPLTGLISVVLFILSTVVIGFTEYLPPAEKVADFLSGNSSRVSTGGYLGTISAFFMIWFAGSVRSALHEKEGGAGRLSTVAFGGGVAAAVALAFGFSVYGLAGSRAGAVGGISIAEAGTLYDLWELVMGGMLSIFLAVFIGATAVVSIRGALFPAWFGWMSVLIAFGLLTPVAYLFIYLAVMWLVVVSIWLYIRGGSLGEPSAVAENT